MSNDKKQPGKREVSKRKLRELRRHRPGTVIRLASGTEYVVQKDHSWRLRR